MRKLYLMIIMHCALCIMHSICAQNKTVILFEDFENGIPATWTQEQIFGNYDWVVESGDLKDPVGTTSGTKRVAFRNNTNQTTASVTRLVLPAVDLSKIFHPILTFSYAQDKWAGDFDTLRILYRRTPNSKWVTLKTYDTYSSEWQRDTIRLAAVTSNYQIAFEGKDNLGRGIVIDDVEIRSIPNCTQPFNLSVSKIRGTSARLEWAGSFDALTYDVVIVEEQMSLDELDSYSQGYEVDGAEYMLDVNNLKPATKYYFYVRSKCIGENSDWSDAGTFVTSSVVDLPYVQNFNMGYTQNRVSSIDSWFCYSSNNAVPPFVNTDHLKSKRLLYSTDSTTALFFQGMNDVQIPISRGGYSYAVTPEINVDKISKLQMSFWTINNVTIPVAANPAISDFCKIIVGVMIDPSDKNTFVAIDTVEIVSAQEFEEVIISFENYGGNGKFIAFMSDFNDGTNAFVIDNLVIDYIPTTPKAQLKVGLPSSEAIDVTFLEHESKRYEVIVANAQLDVNKIDNRKVIKRQEFSSFPCRVEGLQPWVNYFVYGRHLNDGDTGAWSNPTKILTPEKLDTVPFTITFDINSFDVGTYYTPGKSTYQLCNGIIALSNHDKYPMSTNAYWTAESPNARTAWELAMSALFVDDYQIAIFPEMLDPQKTTVSFFATRHLREYLGGYPVVGVLAYGIISDANDVESFHAIDTIVLDFNEYKLFECDLSDYVGNGGFFAIKTDFDYAGASMVWIDDVRFRDSAGCEEPSNVQAKVEEDAVTITWDDNGASSWNVLLSRSNYLPDELDDLSSESYFVKKTTDKPFISISGLESGKKDYYYYIQSECNDMLGAWTFPYSFVTECLSKESIPYAMNFDDEEWAASAYIEGFTVPCLFTKQSKYEASEPGEEYFYPHLSSAEVTTGTKSLLLGASVKDGYSSYIAFPMMNAELSALQISFDMKADSLSQVIEVGVMTDAEDVSTFNVLTKVTPKVDWNKFVVKFDKYEGSGYIAIRTAGETNRNYIDNVIIDWIIPGGEEPGNSDCPKPFDVEFSDITATTASINWKSEADLYKLVVSSRELSIEERDLAVIGDDILVVEELNVKTYRLANLKSNSVYFVYLKAICDNQTSSAWAIERLYTNCVPQNTYDLGVESFDKYGAGVGTKPNCYIVGNKTVNAPDLYIPYCSDEYAFSGKYSLKLTSTLAYNHAYAITPEIDIDSISRLRVRFRASVGDYLTSQYACELTIAVVTDPSDLITQTNITTIKINPGEEFLYEVRFDEYLGDGDDNFGRYVMFLSQSHSNMNNTVFIDDVVFDTIPKCVYPKVEEIAVESDRISLRMDKGNLPYQVKYIVGNYSQEELDAAVVTDVTNNNFEITGLAQNTNCYLMVRSTCDGGYSDWSPVLHFVSAKLDTTSLPYYDPFTQNRFEGEYNNPLDWTTIYTSQEAEEKYRYPYVISDNGGDKVVYLYSNSASEVSYMATPYIDVDDLSKCQVSFNYKPDVSSYRAKRAVVVGVATDVSSKAKVAETFKPLDTIITVGASMYKQYVVSLSQYSGKAKHVVFMVSSSLNRAKITDENGTYGGCYIDDVLVELTPTCLQPMNFRLQDIGDTYAKFVFSHAGASQYEVKYGLAGFDVTNEGSTMIITDTAFTINGLRPNTEYDFYVRAYCSATDVSSWSLCERYTTFEIPVSEFTYENQFDKQEENVLWKFSAEEQNIVSVHNKWYNNDSLYISSNGGLSSVYKNKETKTWAYRTFDMKEGVYTVSFDWMAQGNVSDYMRVFLIPALSQFSEGSENVFNFDGSVVTLSAAKQLVYPADWVDLNRDGNPFNGSSVKDKYSKTFLVTPEMAGFYRLVVYWENSETTSSESNISAVIDNLVIEKSACSYPYKFEIEDINATNITLSWTPVGSTPKSYNVVALKQEMNPNDATEGYIAARVRVDSPIATIPNLESNTDYFIYIQSDCDGNGTLSHWSEVYRFTTPCDPKPIGTIFSFETNEGYYLPNYDDGEPNSYYRIPDCFVVRHANREEVPYVKDNTLAYPHAYRSGTKQMARSGEYAMRFYYNSEEKVGGYAALPLIDGNFEDLQVTFWMRPFAAIKNPQGDNVGQEGLNKIYARKITVGTMTNPNDPSTFTALKVLSYPFSNEDPSLSTGQLVMDDVEKTDYWRKYSVLLKDAKGKFIAFKNELYDGCIYNQMYIDDVVVEYISDCSEPYGLMIEEATATTARINAEVVGKAKYEIQISKIEDCSTIWRTDTIEEFPALLKNLEPGQDYYFRARQVCGVSMYSGWSSIANCITAYSTLYSTEKLKTFDTGSYSPTHWQRACGTSAADIFSKAGSAMVTDNFSPLGWRVKDGHLATYVSAIETKATNPYCWMFSPSIELPQGEVTMSFDLAMSDDDGVHKADSTVNNKNDKFYVVISDDNGRNWEEEKKFTWTNDGKGDFEYNSIPFEGRTYTLDLSRYAGKIIRIGFYSECTTPTVTSELHLNNIHINAVVRQEVNKSICETSDYSFGEFSKRSTELNIGENKFVFHKHSDSFYQPDSIYDINVTVRPLSVDMYNADICDGDVFSQYGFKDITRGGVYKQKLKSSIDCDSVVVVNINVNPIPEIVFTDTICFGASYSWNGHEYDRTGMYVDTLVSSRTGCDSIITLLLNVADAPIVYDTINICSGSTYQFGDKEISESGVYTETFKSAVGCDSIVTLHVNIADDFRLILNEFMCPGETYTGHGFKGVPIAGSYILPLTSVGGCDSTIVLNLYELSDDTIYVEQKITLDQLPYTFVSKTFGKDTELGIYTEEFFVEREGCSSVVMLTLEVGESVGVEDVDLAEWVIYPNPVRVGEKLYIEGNFTQDELDGMQIEVYTILGACIYSSQYSTIDKQFSIDVQGLYVVRLVAGNGNVYQTKVMVQ